MVILSTYIIDISVYVHVWTAINFGQRGFHYCSEEQLTQKLVSGHANYKYTQGLSCGQVM